MLPQWVLNLGPQLFRSNALFELLRHVLLGILWKCLLFLHSFNLALRSFSQSTRAWPYMEILDFPSNTCLNSSDPNDWSPRFNTDLGNIFLIFTSHNFSVCLSVHAQVVGTPSQYFHWSHVLSKGTQWLVPGPFQGYHSSRWVDTLV